MCQNWTLSLLHDDVIKWKHFPRYWLLVPGIHRSPVNSPHKGQWRRALMFSLICVWINDWVNNREAGDLRRYRAHYNVTVMEWAKFLFVSWILLDWLKVTVCTYMTLWQIMCKCVVTSEHICIYEYTYQFACFVLMWFKYMTRHRKIACVWL